MEKTHHSVRALPDAPGVYFFVGAKHEVLYVGKATSLKDRVKSYFSNTLATARGVHMVRMIDMAKKVDVRTTESVLEALILESKLIRELKPPFNSRDKDDKSYNYLVITLGEAFPRLRTVRGKELTQKVAEFQHIAKEEGGGDVEPLVYGPFPHAGQFKEALKIIRNIFPFYDTAHPVEHLRSRKDKKLLFNESIGVYPPSSITQKEYARTVRYITTLFDGKMKRLMKDMERDMHRFAKREEFEKAGEIKRQLFALQHIEDVSLIRRENKHGTGVEGYRIEGYDIAHLGGKNTVGVMTVLEDGEVKKSEYRSFTIRSAAEGSDVGALKEMLERRFAHPEWKYPRLIVVDGGAQQVRVAKETLRNYGIVIPIVAVTKDARHRARTLQGPIKVRTDHHEEIVRVNAEAHRFALAVHTKKRSKQLLS